MQTYLKGLLPRGRIVAELLQWTQLCDTALAPFRTACWHRCVSNMTKQDPNPMKQHANPKQQHADPMQQHANPMKQNGNLIKQHADPMQEHANPAC